MLENPGKSVPELCNSWSETKAFYRLLDQEKLTDRVILDAHYSGTIDRAINGPDTVFLSIQDTTTLNFSSHKELEGQGPICNLENITGLHLHNTMMVGAQTGAILGLLDTKIYARDGQRRKQQPKSARNREPIEEKESYRWLESYHLARRAQEDLAQARIATDGIAPKVISVGDREADIYELVVEARNHLEQGVGLLVRSQHNRQVEGGEQRLWETIGALDEAGRITVEIPRGNEKKKREVTLAIRYKEVEIDAPADKRRNLKITGTVKLTAIDLREVGNKEEGIHWKLLTTLPVNDLGQARQMVTWYGMRWQIEVFHRVLKTGCRVEKRQMRTMETLKPMIAMDLVVASYIMSLAAGVRCEPERAAAQWFESDELEVISTYFELKNKSCESLGIKTVVLLIAKLGGHLGRKSDGPPGAEVIWRGLQKLRILTAAWLKFSPTKRCG